MDIICARCGRHFNSIEAAREHQGKCGGTLEDNGLHLASSSKDKMASAEHSAQAGAINPRDASRGKGERRVNTGLSGVSADAASYHATSANPAPPHQKPKARARRISRWLKAVLFVLAFSAAGLAIYLWTKNPIPGFLLFGFSFIYSINRWFSYFTIRHKSLGMLYRLLLNLSLLSLLGLLIWSGFELFSAGFVDRPLLGGLIFLGQIVLFVWLWRIVLKNSWRRPSMKLTLGSLVAVFLVFAFAGVEPLATYKDNSLGFMASSFNKFLDQGTGLVLDNSTTTTTVTDASTVMHTTTVVSTMTSVSTTTRSTISVLTTLDTTTVSTIYSSTASISHTGVDFETGTYKNYFLGLVKSPEGVIRGTDCYGEFIVLINNREAKDPTYPELLAFLASDTTDEYPYQYSFQLPGLYYGSAESNIDLDRIKNIIDGIEQPDPPRICADFAERLHNNAERAGIRCAYVSVELSGYNGSSDVGHTLVAFNTTDRGLVYIDDTGKVGYGPSNCDKIVNVQVGEHYIPTSLFPEVGWSWDDMGVVTEVFVTWDGEWN